MDASLAREANSLFDRIFMKYHIIEKKPYDIGDGNKLFAAQMNMIEAIDKNFGKTVTTLSEYFMISKGAVSQIVTKLSINGYISKTKKEDNDREIILTLTDKGRKVLEFNKAYDEVAVKEMAKLRKKYSTEELHSFLSILKDVDVVLGELIAEEKKKSSEKTK